MGKTSSGHVFEASVIKCLRMEQHCDVFTSETLDLKYKVDGEIRSIAGVALAKPVQYQVTRRIDHYTKLRKYLKKHRVTLDFISVYAEAEPDADASEVSESLAWAAVAVQTLPPYGPHLCYGLRIGEDAFFFDPHERLGEMLRERDSPERLSALKRGVIQDIEAQGFSLCGEDGGRYFVHFIEVDDGKFRGQLRALIGQENADIPVLFLPCGRFARDIRQRVLAANPDDRPQQAVDETPAPSDESDPSRP